ncbi:hypothetical protein ACG2LH_03395 [Zhouia sp. PK063]|uniref:hypothetical protein n=1 Tax=Zhouia sp. PK063 TaxID=3373602 RepID=UPI00378E936B
MKNFLIYIAVICSSALYAQVGVGTTSPDAGVMLDVNGKVKIRTVSDGPSASAKDTILVSNAGVVTKTNSTTLVRTHLNSFVKGYMNSITVSILSWKKLPFNQEDFDISSEYNTSSYEYTAKKYGIYRIYVQYKTTLSTATTLSIYKNGISYVTSSSLLSTSGYEVINTLVELNEDDKISFYYYATASLGISVDQNESFFTIEQVY